MSSANNNIPFLVENTIDVAAATNEAINAIDALLQVRVESVGTNTPPGNPATGTRYIVGTNPSGAWAGQANKLARWLDGMWTFFDARYVLNAADGVLYVRPSTAWVASSGGGSGPATPSPVVVVTDSSRTAVVSDAGSYLRFTNASAVTYTISPQSSAAWPANAQIEIRRAGAGILNLAAGAGVTLNSPSGGTLALSDRMSVMLKRVSENAWDVIGQTVAA